MERLDAARRVDRLGQDLLRIVRRHFLDLDPALGRADQGHPAGGAVDQQAEIELAGDVAAFFDIDALDLAALRPGLMGHQLLAEHGACRRRDLVLRAGELDPAGLAAPAGMDLRLDHPDRPPSRRATSTASAAV